jgi:hypothetical protein
LHLIPACCPYLLCLLQVVFPHKQMPVMSKLREPRTLKQRHPLSAFRSTGTFSSGSTREISSSVRVIERN